VRTRLSAIMLIPVVIALVLGGLRVKDSVTTLNNAEDAHSTAELVEAAATYGNALIDERDHTAEPLLHGDKHDPRVHRYRAASDRAKAAFDRAAAHMPDTPGLRRRLAAFRRQEPKLAELRAKAYGGKTSGVETEEGYVTVQHPLMEFANELGYGSDRAASYGRTVYSLSLAKAGESLQRSIGLHLLLRPGPAKKDKKTQVTAFSSYAYLERLAEEEYVGGGSPEDIRLLKRELAAAKPSGKNRPSGSSKSRQTVVSRPPMPAMVKAIGSGAPPSKLRDEGVTADGWFTAATGKFDAYRATEKQLTRAAVRETGSIASDARRDAIVNGSVTLAALVLALAIAALMARSMSRGMRELRTAALEVAGDRLPALVEQLSRTEPARVDTRVGAIPIDSRDEIGEVARAFDQVHREAVRLAAEQALLRGNVSAIFTNLSRRNTDMIERQLGLISELEQREPEPEQLENLFRLDHLATRMRRNDENLLVLAGAEPGRRWHEPVPLVDILRAASSEVEQYERISLSGVPDSEIHGRVVGDLVHLLAELLENATTFSSPQTHVRVEATRLPDGRVMIEIHDRGIGLTPEDFADLNRKLADPPTVDAAVSRRMGLYVVGRLANRHGIRVQLRPSGERDGTTCVVTLPDSITHGGGGEADRPAPEDRLTPSRFFSERPGGERARAPGQRSGAAGPLGPSLRREELRPAPEPQQAERDRQFGQDRPYEPGGTDRPYEPGRPEGRSDQAQYGPQSPYPQQPGGDESLLPQLPEGSPSPREFEPPRMSQSPGVPQPPRPEQAGPGMPDAPPPSPQPPQQLTRPGEQLPRQPQQRLPQQPSSQPDRDPHPGPQQPPYPGQYGPEQYGPEQYDPLPYDPQQYGTGPAAEPPPVPGPELGPATPYPATPYPGSPYPAATPYPGDARTPAARQYGPGPEYPYEERPLGTPEAAGAADGAADPGEDWRSPNDERWDRAGRLRTPSAGGVTTSGLPRRVPRANLVEGSAEQPERSGSPSVSRTPEDVRGRLNNLHRGVRRARDAGQAIHNDGRGRGPGGTYDQEL